MTNDGLWGKGSQKLVISHVACCDPEIKPFTHYYLGKRETFEEGSTRCKFAKIRYSAHYESEITTCKIQEAPMALCSEESCPYFHKGDAYIIIRKERKEE